MRILLIDAGVLLDTRFSIGIWFLGMCGAITVSIRKPVVAYYFPHVITYDEEGHEIGVTTRKSFKQEVSEEYRPYEESAWDYVPVIGATMLALDHVKKGRWAGPCFIVQWRSVMPAW